MRLHVQTFTVLLLILSCGCGDGSVQEKCFVFSRTGTQVTMCQAYVHARSKIDCVRTCRRFSLCASFVFEKSSGVCYLNPNVTPGSGRQLYLYEDPVPVCDPRTTAALKNGRVQVWKQTLTALEGDVTCDGDFMETATSGKIRCMDNGTWERAGECAQYIFRSPVSGMTVQSFKIPRPVIEGWSVCIEGTPTENTRFTVVLETGDGNVSLSSDHRLSYGRDYRTTVAKVGQKNAWKKEFRFSEYFPFVVQQPFKLQILLKKKNKFKIKANDKILGNIASIRSLPLQTAFVTVKNSVSLQLMNVWCSP